MAKQITNEQMRNLMGTILFKSKRDLNRNYKNLLWFIGNFGKDGVTEDVLRDGLRFELSSYTTSQDDEKVIFIINKDYSQTFYSAKNFEEGLELLHQQLMQVASWYRNLLTK